LFQQKSFHPQGRKHRGTTQFQAFIFNHKDSSNVLTVQPAFLLSHFTVRYLKGNSGAEFRDKSEPRMCFQPMTHPLCEEEIPYLITFIVFVFWFILDILTDKIGKVNTIFF